jgi:hypothetical protein
MSATTAATIVRGAFDTIGVLGEADTMDAAKGADGLRRLNLMMRSLMLQNLSIPVTVREVFDLVANQGGPTNPYTIGVGGTFNTQRPPTQNSLVGAGLILTNVSPTVEIPRTIFTDDAWQAIQIKGLQSGGSGIPTGIYYNPTYTTSGLGSIYMWPIPQTGDNDIALYLRKTLTTFADLTTSYQLPDGCEEALEYNLAVRLCGPYSVPVDPDVKALAKSSMAIFKRSNYHLVDLPIDPALTNDRRGGYNIQTGNY